MKSIFWSGGWTRTIDPLINISRSATKATRPCCKTTYLHRLAVRIKIIIKHEVENCRSIGRIRTIVVQRYTLHHLPLKVLCSLYVLSAMCVTTYLKAMLTDGFLLSVSSRAANYAPHKTIMLHGGLSATSPAHHRMAINHLLHRLIYNALLRTRCHTQTESMITTQRVVDALICLFIKGFPCT